MANGYDVFAITSAGTGVAETELGTGITTPTQAHTIASVIPYTGATGAYTAAQGCVHEVAFRSDSIPLTPKRIISHGGNGGVGTFIDVLVPILEEWKFYTPISAQSVIRCFVTPQTANTVAFDQGCAIQYNTESPNMPEKFWMKPTNETSTGTAAAKVTGDQIVLNSGTDRLTVTDCWALAYVAGVVTVSESLYGFMEFQANEFDDAMPIRVPVQPMGAGLATSTLMMAKLARFALNKPSKGQTTINTAFSMEEAQTAAQAFIGGVGYIKM